MKKEETKEVRHQCMPVIPVLRKQRQKDFCEFKASPVYVVNSRTARATQKNPVPENKQPTTVEKK